MPFDETKRLFALNLVISDNSRSFDSLDDDSDDGHDHDDGLAKAPIMTQR